MKSEWIIPHCGIHVGRTAREVRRHRRATAVIAVVAAVAIACGDTAADGEEGGPCRLGPSTCQSGLVCDHGLCMPPDGDHHSIARAGDWQIEFTPERWKLVADGEDELGFSVRVINGVDGAPYEGPLIVRTLPLAGGRCVPTALDVIAGHAKGRIRACDPASSGCPSSFTLAASFPDWAATTLAESATIRYENIEEGAWTPDNSPVDYTETFAGPRGIILGTRRGGGPSGGSFNGGPRGGAVRSCPAAPELVRAEVDECLQNNSQRCRYRFKAITSEGASCDHICNAVAMDCGAARHAFACSNVMQLRGFDCHDPLDLGWCSCKPYP